MTSFRPEGVDDHLLLIASTTVAQEGGSPAALRLRIPRSRAYFTGVGVRAALFTHALMPPTTSMEVVGHAA